MIPEVNEDFVLTKSRFFSNSHVWPLQNRVDPDAWLGNFDSKDKRFAVQLLNSFLYISDDWVDRIFVSAIQGLSRTVTSSGGNLAQRRLEWSRFLNESVVTFPTGERPFAGDSGHGYVRRARNLVGLDEERVVAPQTAIELLLNGDAKSVIFVDDFVGTGLQFSNTWERPYSPPGYSFDTLFDEQPFPAFYCPIFCTTYSAETELSTISRRVKLCPANWLTDAHSLFSDNSIWWPESLKPNATDFIYRYSMDIGLPESDGYDERDWQGFHKLGLTVSFRDSCPDATIPLFDSSLGGWRPLWKR